MSPTLARYLLAALKVRQAEEKIQREIARLDFNRPVEQIEAQVFEIEERYRYRELVDAMLEAKRALRPSRAA